MNQWHTHHYQRSICTRISQASYFDTNYVSSERKLPKPEPINFNSTITMPTQGPGAKLVLKGLKRAFPRIAEQREREEQEEREERESGERGHASRNDDNNHRQGSSVHPNAGNSRNQNQPEDNMRSESIRRGPSAYPMAVSRTNHNQSRNQSRSGSIQQGRSIHSNAGLMGSRDYVEDDEPIESIRRGSSLYSNMRSSRSGGSQRRPTERHAQTFVPHGRGTSTELQRRERGSSSVAPASTRGSTGGRTTSMQESIRYSR